jgi:peptidyl-Lys metalloendopeptidase
MLFLTLFTVAAADFSQLQSQLSFVDGVSGYSVDFTLTNPTMEAISVPIHLTPFDGITADIFEFAGPNAVTYTGMYAKRFAEEMLTIAAGQSATTTVDISFDYAFPATGIYKLLWRFGQSNPVKAEISTVYGDRRAAMRNTTDAEGAPNNFVNCQATERTQTLAADTQATTDCRNSVACLNANSCAARYVTWFGVRTDARYQQTQRNFVAISNNFNSGNYRIHCNPTNCPANTYAFVYPTDRTHVVYLCSVFWRIPAERAETLVHELSHFTDVASTQDFQYGQSGCRALARSNPANAVRNADNVCYFGRGYTF